MSERKLIYTNKETIKLKNKYIIQQIKLKYISNYLSEKYIYTLSQKKIKQHKNNFVKLNQRL